MLVKAVFLFAVSRPLCYTCVFADGRK